MAKTGVSIPICAAYKNLGSGRVSYTEPYVADSAVEYSVDIEANEDNNLYADNKVKETAGGSFSSGTLSLTTSDIEAELAIKMFGLKTVKRMVDGKEIDEVVNDDEAKPPELGFGIIEEHQVDGVRLYKPIVLTRVRFKNPGLAATTRENKIDWQTQKVEATILRSEQADDKYKYPWQFSPKDWYTNEEDARKYIMSVLNSDSTTSGGEN